MTTLVRNDKMHSTGTSFYQKKNKLWAAPQPRKGLVKLKISQLRQLFTLLDFSKSFVCPGELITNPQYAGLVHIPSQRLLQAAAKIRVIKIYLLIDCLSTRAQFHATARDS